MPSTGLSYGPYALTSANVDKYVSAQIGTYVLGHESNGSFYLDYVGRSDTDVNNRLKDWAPTKYQMFKFDYFATAKAAFERECQIYHDFSGLDNDVHPARPKGATYGCPHCRALD